MHKLIKKDGTSPMSQQLHVETDDFILFLFISKNGISIPHVRIKCKNESPENITSTLCITFLIFIVKPS